MNAGIRTVGLTMADQFMAGESLAEIADRHHTTEAAVMRLIVHDSGMNVTDIVAARHTFLFSCDPATLPFDTLDALRRGQTVTPGTATDVGSPAANHVREAIAIHGPDLTSAQYSQWAASVGRPGVAALLQLSGHTWAELVAQAGGNAKPRTLWTDTTVRAALEQFFTEEPDSGSEQYRTWSQTEPGRPSRATVCRLFGSWPAVAVWARTATEDDHAA